MLISLRYNNRALEVEWQLLHSILAEILLFLYKIRH